jgi:drug/metabolite transporter (DMT)-like permease
MVTEQSKGILAAVLSPFFIALGVMVAKMAGHSGAQPLLITAISGLMSVPFLLPLQKLGRTKSDLAVLFGEMRRPFLQLLVSRSIIGSALVVVGFTMTTALKSVLLLRVEALFVFAWSVYYKKEKATAGKIVLLLILILGSVLVVMPSSGLHQPAALALAPSEGLNLGDVLIVTALLFISFSYIPTEEVITKASPTSVNIIANTVSGIFILLVMLLACPQAVFTLSAKALSFIFGYAVIFCVLAVNIYYFAFKTIKPWIIACFMSLEVVYGVPLAWLIHAESLTLLQAIGAVIVMAATAGIGLLNARESAGSKAPEA